MTKKLWGLFCRTPISRHSVSVITTYDLTPFATTTETRLASVCHAHVP